MIKIVGKPWLLLGWLGNVVFTVRVLINARRQSSPIDFSGEKLVPQVKSFYAPVMGRVAPVAAGLPVECSLVSSLIWGGQG